MDLTNLKNVKITREQLMQAMKQSRALTDPTTTPFTTYDVEELEKQAIITTPVFTPLLNSLRPNAKRSKSWQFEWNDKQIQTTLTQVKYDGYTPPSDYQSTANRRVNYIMPCATVAKVSAFTNSFEAVDVDALQNELNDKMLDLFKGVEYYLWNGDSTVTGGATETNGLISVVTTSVSMGSAPLSEDILNTAIVQCYAEGGEPDTIYATPLVCQRIADFMDTKIRFFGNSALSGGKNSTAFMFKSPFGFDLKVIPVLPEFISTGSVYVIDSKKLTMRYSSPSPITTQTLQITQHGQALILFSFMGLQTKCSTQHHRKITNVLETV